MGYLSHRALLPARRDLGFQERGKHRWIVEIHKCLDQRKFQAPKCRSCLHGHCSQPVPISYIRQDTGDCHTLPSKFCSGEREDEWYTARLKYCACWLPASHRVTRGGTAHVLPFAMSTDPAALWLGVQHEPSPL